MLPSLPCLGLPTMGWPSSGAPQVCLGAVGWPVPPVRLPSWGGSVGWPGNRPARGNSLAGSLHIDKMNNSVGGSLHPDRVDNTLVGSLPPDKVDSSLERSLTEDRGATKTARVEHRLPPKQEVGGTLRGVTDAARRGTRGTMAATRRQSNSPRSSPSGKMQLTSKHRQRTRPWENRTQVGTWTDSKHAGSRVFLHPCIKH